MKKEMILPIICAVLGNVIWGCSLLFIRVALQYASSEQLLAHRFTLSALLMLIPLMLRKMRFPVKGKSVAPFENVRFSFKGKPLGAVILLMAMQLAYFFFETKGILYTNSTFAGMVLAAVPIGSIFTGAIFLKEYPTKRQAFFCLLPIAGIIIMTLSGGELGVISLPGVVCLFLCMCCSAFYKTANRKAADAFSTYERTLLILGISAVAFTAVSLPAFGWDIRSFLAPLGNASYTLPVLFLSLLCSIAANLLVNYSAGKMSVFTLASFGALSTLVSTFLGVVVLDEPVSWMLLTGAAMIVFGVQQIIRPDKPKKT